MQRVLYVALAAAGVFLQQASASRHHTTTLATCSAITTVNVEPHLECLIECLEPTSVCAPGQLPEQPVTVATTTSACTVSLITPFHCGCPTCVVGAIATPTPTA